MLVVEGNNVGAQDLAIDLPIDGVICYRGKNPPLFHLDCIGWFIAYFDVQLLNVILFDFKKNTTVLKATWKNLFNGVSPIFLTFTVWKC